MKKCPSCNWTGPKSALKGYDPYTGGCPECWRHGHYIPVEDAGKEEV